MNWLTLTLIFVVFSLCAAAQVEIEPVALKKAQLPVSSPPRAMTMQERQDSARRQLESYIQGDAFQEKIKRYNSRLDSCKRIVTDLNERLKHKSYYFEVMEDKHWLGNWDWYVDSFELENIRIARIDKRKPNDPNKRVYYSDELQLPQR